MSALKTEGEHMGSPLRHYKAQAPKRASTPLSHHDSTQSAKKRPLSGVEGLSLDSIIDIEIAQKHRAR